MSWLARCGVKCSAWIIKGSDTLLDMRIKQDLTPFMLVLMPLFSVLLVRELSDEGNPTMCVALSLWIGCFVVFFAWGTAGKRMTKILHGFILGFTIGIIMMDLFMVAGVKGRIWALVVVMLDVALVYDLPNSIPFVLCLTLLYLTVESTESVLRFGLYDVVVNKRPAVCDCADPPCAEEVSA
eukprot:Hpha_TRINITY_DN16445_c5_g3::TRINITY_DN16445_c5_g3_i1::g.159076::m.159076